MTFVNEFVSEEDIRKYGLDDLMRNYDSWSWRDGRPGGFVHTWTIDRERNAYFVLVKVVEETGRSGRNEPTNGRVFVLSWRGRKITFRLEKSAESTTNINVIPFKQVWELVGIDPAESPDVSRKDVVEVVKDALREYGFWGAHRQVPNTIVEFKF